jgi:hypothetical protein
MRSGQDNQLFWIRMVAFGFIGVTRSGVITTYAGEVTLGTLNNVGYYIFSAYDFKHKRSRTIPVHRLVWLAYRGRIPPDCDINHIDGDKHNNRLENLEVATRSENMKHAVRLGLLVMPVKKGDRGTRAVLSDDEVRALRKAWDKAKGKMSQARFARKHATKKLGAYGVLGVIRRQNYKDVV